MKKGSIRDFNYDHSDIVLAVIIIAIAASLILWRVQIIMAYPTTINTQTAVTEQAENTDGVEHPDQNTEETVTTGKTKATWSEDKLAEDFVVEVTGDSPEAIAQSLVDLGLFTSTVDVDDTCAQNKLDKAQFKAGKYTFMEGMTKKDVAALVAGAD